MRFDDELPAMRAKLQAAVKEHFGLETELEIYEV